MSEESMDVLSENQQMTADDCEMEQESVAQCQIEPAKEKTETKLTNGKKDTEQSNNQGKLYNVPDSCPRIFFPNEQILIGDKAVDKNDPAPDEINEVKSNCEDKNLQPNYEISQPYQRELTPPTTLFQKPTVCRTNSLGSNENSPFTIIRRPNKISLSNQIQSPSPFRRKLCMQSPLRGSLLPDFDDNVLKRCNSAPMLNDINDIDPRAPWSHTTNLTPGSIRARRFSATVVSVHASPSAGTAKSTSRLNQLKKEESLEGIKYKETAHEREVQNSLQMNHTCEELSLSDSHDSLNGILTGNGDGTSHRGHASHQFIGEIPNSPQPSSTPTVSISSFKKQCPTRAIDFSSPGSGTVAPHHHPGGIPSPLTISPSSCMLNLSPLPPSPTRSLGLSSTGKQCFSPSMQAPIPIAMRPVSLSPSPSPTRRTFVTRRRSQSPCIMKPSALGPIKRKYDSDSEGGCSPKRMFLPAASSVCGSVTHNNNNIVQAEQLPHMAYNNILTPFYPRSSIHRSHSLSSSSVDSDVYVSPSPPQSFLSSNNNLGPSHSGSPFQSPLHSYMIHGIQSSEGGRCPSPASSTCSTSSLEGMKELQQFSQNHLNIHHGTNGVLTPTLLKPVVKSDQQPTITMTPASAANITS